MFILGLLFLSFTITAHAETVQVDHLSDDIICFGRAWNDRTTVVTTKVIDGQRQLFFFLNHHAEQIFKTSFDIKTTHSIGLNSVNDLVIHINGSSKNEGDLQFAQLRINIKEYNMPGNLMLTLPVSLLAERESTPEFSFHTCRFIETVKRPVKSAGCSIL